jgi:N-acetylglutamate synthase-like GNAT family acetyltransferase
VIALRAPRRRDVLKIVRLADEVFGDGYLVAADVNSRFIVLTIDGSLAGFVNTDIWDNADATDTDGFTLGLIETVVVRPTHRGVGLGNILVATAVATLMLEEVDLIECYATTWSDSGSCFIKGSLERNGFEAGTHYPRMWENDAQDFICRACKAAPCLCDATLYRREVNRRGE